MEPTNHFKWCLATTYEEECSPCVTPKRNWPELAGEAYVLKQWWAGDGTGEWRIVHSDDSEDPPY